MPSKIENIIKLPFLFFFFLLSYSSYSQSVFDLPEEYQVIDSTKLDFTKQEGTLFWSDNFGMQFSFEKDKSQDKFLICPIAVKKFKYKMPPKGTSDLLTIYPYIGNSPLCAKASITSAISYIPMAQEDNSDEFKRRMLILNEKEIADDLMEELAQLKLDLIGDGYRVGKLEVDKSLSSIAVKAMIQEYKKSHSDLSGLYLLGNIPYAESGNLRPDGHLDHQGAQLADFYYADLDGVWTDTIDYVEGVPNSIFANKKGDGKFDQSIVPVIPKIEIGRAFFGDLPVFQMSEIDLTKRYLNKVHRHKIIKDEYDHLYFEGMTNTGHNHLYTLYYDMISKPSDVIKSDNILAGIEGKNVLIGVSNNTGGPTFQNGGFRSQDLISKKINAKFMFLVGSYFYDLRYQNNLIRCLLASESSTIATYWGLSKNISLTYAANGRTLGRSNIAIAEKDNFKTDVINFYTGDPSIKLKIINQVSGFVADKNKNHITLSWDEHQDPDILGFKIYRSTNIDSQFVLLNSLPIKATSFSDIVSAKGEYFYMIKAVKKEYSRSSSFLNYSTGKILQVSIDELSATIDLKDFSSLKPNPAQNTICQQNHFRSDVISRNIFDTYGRVVLNFKTKQECLDISPLSNGHYILQTNTNEGQFYQRFIKAHE